MNRVPRSFFTSLPYTYTKLASSPAIFSSSRIVYNSNSRLPLKTMSSITPKQEKGTTRTSYVEYRSLVPPLSSDLHKGQGGRVGILGGSSDYTGAPYFSGMAALRLGADLCHIICDEDAATAIKSYSPDLIVHPYIKIRTTNSLSHGIAETEVWQQTFKDIDNLLKRVHVLVIGPGLSRDQGMLLCAVHAIEEARSLEIPIVIDADGLFLLQNEPHLIDGYTKAVLTPNLVEFGRLCKAMNVDAEDELSDEPAVQKLSNALGGVVVIQKGEKDVISDGTKVQVVSNEGGLKRSGGQGDILTGMIATSLAWGEAYKKDIWRHSHSVQDQDIALTACYGACVINRECSRLAFQKHGRSVQSSDMLAEIGPYFHRLSHGADWVLQSKQDF